MCYATHIDRKGYFGEDQATLRRYTKYLSRGRYLKAAERACVRKARFETAAAAEAFVERRYRAYRCVVCGRYHLTSGRGDRREEPAETPRKQPPGPTLGDLDWSAVLDPKPKKAASQPPPPASPPCPLSKTNHLKRGTALCAGSVGKDGRVLLVVNRRLMKSKKVEAGLRALLAEGIEVEINGGDPPTVIRVLES